jgi:dolichol-phosphate mannosyltransferase
MTYELTVVIPTLNERGNIQPLLEALDRALASISWEVIFVDDDSADGTVDAVWAEAAARPNVRAIRRVGRRGLASATIEGMLASGAPYLAVMDGDLQHDESLLPQMLAAIKSDDLDIVVASRFAAGSQMVNFSSRRERMSRVGNWLSARICRASLSDPLSGFFLLHRRVLDEVVYSLSGLGFKILVDIFASSRRPLRFAEVPSTFRTRQHGASKLDSTVLAEFLMLLGDKTIGRLVPVRFLAFLLVGVAGMIVHMAALAVLLRAAGLPFLTGHVLATSLAIFCNYYFNNRLTFRDHRRRGATFWAGLALFYAACAFGAAISYTLARALYQSGAGWVPAGGAGALVGGIWNYNMTSFFVWRSPRRRA